MFYSFSSENLPPSSSFQFIGEVLTPPPNTWKDILKSLQQVGIYSCTFFHLQIHQNVRVNTKFMHKYHLDLFGTQPISYNRKRTDSLASNGELYQEHVNTDENTNIWWVTYSWNTSWANRVFFLCSMLVITLGFNKFSIQFN